MPHFSKLTYGDVTMQRLKKNNIDYSDKSQSFRDYRDAQ